MLRADTATARQCRRDPGRRRAAGAAAQSRPRRRLRGHPVRTRLRTDMVDHSVAGRALTPVTAQVEPGRLRFFRETTGERNPVYSNADAARAAGYAAVPVPPTYLFCLEMMDAEQAFEFLDILGADLSQVLHGEQRFTYRAPVMVGDTLRFEPRIASVTDKKGGAMTLAVVETRVTNQHGVHVADCSRTVVVLNKVAA